MSWAICDRRIATREKGKVYRMIIKPAMVHGLETLTLTKRKETELKMLRLSMGMSGMDMGRNECIRGNAQVNQFGDKVREARLRLSGPAEDILYKVYCRFSFQAAGKEKYL